MNLRTENKRVRKRKKDLAVFLEELAGIQDFKLDKERVEFRPDIFSRIVE